MRVAVFRFGGLSAGLWGQKGLGEAGFLGILLPVLARKRAFTLWGDKSRGFVTRLSWDLLLCKG